MNDDERKCVEFVLRHFEWARELTELIESGGIPDESDMTIHCAEIARELSDVGKGFTGTP